MEFRSPHPGDLQRLRAAQEPLLPFDTESDGNVHAIAIYDAGRIAGAIA